MKSKEIVQLIEQGTLQQICIELSATGDRHKTDSDLFALSMGFEPRSERVVKGS